MLLSELRSDIECGHDGSCAVSWQHLSSHLQMVFNMSVFHTYKGHVQPDAGRVS